MNREPQCLIFTIIRILGIVALLVPIAIFGQVPTSQEAHPSGNETPTKCNSNDVKAAFAPGPDHKERLEKYLVVCREAGNKAHIAWILRAIGDLEMLAGDVDKAISVWQEALSINEARPNLTGSITAILSIGSAFRYQKNDKNRAGEYLRKLLQFSVNPRPEYRAQIAGALGSLADFEARDGDPEKALVVSDTILTLRQEVGDERGIIGALSHKGYVCSLVGDKAQALELYQQALIRSEQLHDKALLASILSRIGDLYRQMGYHAYSLDHFERSLKISEQLEISNQLFSDLSDVAWGHYQLGDRQKALEVLNRLLKILGDLQYDPLSKAAKSLRQRHGAIVEAFIKTTIRSMGQIYFELGMYDSSIHFFQRTAAIAEKNGDTQLMILATRSVGEVKLAQGRYEEAIVFFQKSLAISNSGDGRYRNLGMFSLTRIADICARQHRFAEAREFANRAELLSKQLTDKDGYYPFVAVGSAYVILGDFEKARTSLERAISLAEANTRRITDEEERLKFFEQIQDPYKLYIP